MRFDDHPESPPQDAGGQDELERLREQVRTERRVAEMSRSFLALELDELEDGVRAALAALASGMGADRAQLAWIRKGRGGRPSLDRYTWAAPGVEPMRADYDPAACPWLVERLRAGEIVHAPRVSELPDEAAVERRALLAFGNRSYLAIPILWRRRLKGSLDLRGVRSERCWSQAEIERLQLLGDVLASVLGRREAEVERKEIADRFNAMVENLDVSLCEAGPDGSILYASPRIPELLGYSQEQVVGRRIGELLEPATDEPGQAAGEAGHSPIRGVFRIRHRDGSLRQVDLVGRSYHTRDGETRHLTLLRDVTHTQSRNAELELLLRLERLVSDLSRRLLSSGASEIDRGIGAGLESLARVGAADRAFFVSLPELRRDRPSFFEWCGEAVAARGDSPTTADAAQYQGFASRLIRGEVIRVPVVAEMPDELSVEREAMLAAGIQSYLLVPAISRGKLVGLLGVHCVTRQRDFPEHEVTLLQVVANLFMSALRRKRSETALAENEARFRALAENSQDSICELSAEGRIHYASPAFAALVGSGRDELEEQSLVDLVHPLDGPLVKRSIESAGAESAGTAIVFRTRHRDGHWLDLEMTARSFETAVGEARRVAVLRDVSRRERDRRALERQVAGEQQIAELSRFFLDLEHGATRAATREKLAVAAGLAGAERSWMFTLDPRGTEPFRRDDWSADGDRTLPPRLPDSVDAFAWAIAGLNQGRELHASRVADLPEEARTEREDLLARGVRSFLGIPLRSGRKLIGMMGFEVSSGEREWSPESITLLRLVGQIFVSALRREQAEFELERSQSQLLQSQKMEAVGTLAGGIAHDFNNHLAVMLGNARFIAIAPDRQDPEVRDALADLQGSAEHCAQLTRSLLAFSRRSPVAIQTVAVGSVMSAVGDLVRPLLPSSIAFEIESAEAVDAVRGDPTQLRQVLINLLVNARDAMPEGGTLRLASRRRRVHAAEARALGLESPGRYVELVVRDGGQGMSEEIRARVFEPFFTTKRVGEGTGLGLATAYGIVQQCAGAIACESEPGRGTTFRVLLPLAEGPAVEHEAEGSVDPGIGCETILLVEDEPAVRRLLTRTLRRRGYRVLEARDGVEALAVFEGARDTLDLLVTDLAMPRVGGLELTGKLQALQPELPVLFLSGHGEPVDTRDGAKVRRARFLQKPFDEAALLREIRVLLEDRTWP